jgi:myo-inositol-1(or 4)-monophosphatase
MEFPRDLLFRAAHTAVVAAIAGGQAALRAWRPRLGKSEKSAPRDLVTDGDLAAQQAVCEEISRAFPGYEIVSEEGTFPGSMGELRWVVDPIDGTTNYYHGVPFFAVSVAFCAGDEPLAGAVYDPVRHELFTGVLGNGAYLNGARIEAPCLRGLEEVVFGVGLSYSSGEMGEFLQLAARVAPLCSCVRSLGSAALALSYIACGRMDCYLHPNLAIWDAAAGVLILREAGGLITGFDGQPWVLGNGPSLAANASIHRQLLEQLREALLSVRQS